MARSIREVYPHEIQYVRQETVALGGFSDIHLAFWTDSHKDGTQQLAVKSFRGSHLISEDEQKTLNRRLRNEVETWQRAQPHPNILPFLGIYRSNKMIVPALISPYRPDGNIMTYLMKHPSTDRHELSIGVVQGVVHLHHWNIVHGDLTPNNILLHVDTKGKLLPQISDFGRAKILGVKGFTGSLHAIYRYSAPEVLLEPLLLESPAAGITPKTKNKLLTPQSDVFSLGMVLLEILSGIAPYPRWSEHQIALVHSKAEAPDFSEHHCEKNHPMGWIWPLLQDCWKFGANPLHRCTANRCLSRLQGLTAGNILN